MGFPPTPLILLPKGSMINRLSSSCSQDHLQEGPLPWHPRVAPITWDVGDPQDVCYPCPTAMTLLGLFPAYPPYPAETTTLPRVPSQESPATGWARSCPRDVTPSALPSSPLALPRGTLPCQAAGHPAISFGVTPGQARALHPLTEVSPRPDTLAHPPGREREAKAAGRSAHRRGAPRGGSAHPEAWWERWGGRGVTGRRGGQGWGAVRWGSNGCCAGGSGCCAGWGTMSAAEVGVLRTDVGGGH